MNPLEPPSDAGGQRAAVMYSLIEIAKLNNIDLPARFKITLERIASGWPLDTLMPWNHQAP